MSGEYKSSCGCLLHVIHWTSKRKLASVKLCPLHKAAPKLLAALKEMAEWHGSEHDADCPCDDACECSLKPFNDSVNSAINAAEGR